MPDPKKAKRAPATKIPAAESLDITRRSLKARGPITIFLVVAALAGIALAWVLVHESKPNVTASGPNSMAIGVASGPITINNGKEAGK